jgi:hypothetical protein
MEARHHISVRELDLSAFHHHHHHHHHYLHTSISDRINAAVPGIKTSAGKQTMPLALLVLFCFVFLPNFLFLFPSSSYLPTHLYILPCAPMLRVTFPTCHPRPSLDRRVLYSSPSLILTSSLNPPLRRLALSSAGKRPRRQSSAIVTAASADNPRE